MQILNEYRSSLPQHLPYLQETESQVKIEVTEITKTYQVISSIY